MSISKSLHHHNPYGVTADVFPMYHEGKYHLFPGWVSTIHNFECEQRLSDKFGHLSSENILEWENHGPIIECKTVRDSRDSEGIGTGSFLVVDGVWHFFYCAFSNQQSDSINQTIYHATSTDMVHWEEDPENPILMPDLKNFSGTDFRDPCVIWDENKQEYLMLIAARTVSGPPIARGCIAQAHSKDLKKWELDETPFWAPGDSYVMECPQLFKLGKYWYLLYSRQYPQQKTVYVMSETMYGPWKRPYPYEIENKRFYAAKIVDDGQRQFAFGWIWERDHESDDRPFIFGGDMALPHQVVQCEDGRLQFRCPDEIAEAYRDEECKVVFKNKADFSSGLPELKLGADNTISGESDGLLCASLYHENEKLFMIEAEFELSDEVEEAGFYLKCRDDLGKGHRIVVRPKEDCAILYRWPEKVDAGGTRGASDDSFGHEDDPQQVDGFPPARVYIGLGEKRDSARTINLKLFVTGSMVEAFIDEKAALSYRIYDKKDGDTGIFVKGGKVKIKDLHIWETEEV